MFNFFLHINNKSILRLVPQILGCIKIKAFLNSLETQLFFDSEDT